MLFLKAKPSLPLAGCIRMLWYASASGLGHERERVLPNGCAQIIISLASESLTDCGADSGEEALHLTRPMPAAILAGPRSRYDVIHTQDLSELGRHHLSTGRPGSMAPPASRSVRRTVCVARCHFPSATYSRSPAGAGLTSTKAGCAGCDTQRTPAWPHRRASRNDYGCAPPASAKQCQIHICIPRHE